jgi:hypothetical protein
MTFVPPALTVDELDLRLANEILTGANQHLENLKKYRKEQYDKFWFSGWRLRSPAEINAILIQMDRASPGQSGKFFATAVLLVEFILALDPGSLTNEEWYPQHEYTADPVTGEIRMIVPDPPLPEGE